PDAAQRGRLRGARRPRPADRGVGAVWVELPAAGDLEVVAGRSAVGLLLADRPVRAAGDVEEVQERAAVAGRLRGDIFVRRVVVAPDRGRLGRVELPGVREDPVA